MPLGWIDFSKNERSKVLSVMDLLTETGTLDELGIAPVRDGFSNLFFPGTSTIQTRAKYFLIVPYLMKDLERSGENDPKRMLQTLDKMEQSCGQRLLSNGEDRDGIIGSRSLAGNRWVKRTPADIYWAGLRSYEIFLQTMSLSEYIKAICFQKKQRAMLGKLSSGQKNSDENDDKDAGAEVCEQLWNIPTYKADWKTQLSIGLSEGEGQFLKTQIIRAFPDSMLGYLLKHQMRNVMECRDFHDLGALICQFPKQIQQDYQLAVEFSSFLYVLRTVYNRIVSDRQNQKAEDEWEKLAPRLEEYASVNLEAIFTRLQLTRNVLMCSFLRQSQSRMKCSDLDGLETAVKKREKDLKGNRAKTMHPGEFDPNAWFGGGRLDYRFSNAKRIICDLFESEGIHVKS